MLVLWVCLDLVGRVQEVLDYVVCVQRLWGRSVEDSGSGSAGRGWDRNDFELAWLVDVRF